VPFPPKLLHEHEEVVLDLRPHWWYLAGPSAFLVVALAGLVAVSSTDAPDWVVWGAAGVAVGSVAWFAGRYLRWTTTQFDRVNTIFSSQRIVERMVGTGDLVVESGGELGQQTFSDIPRPALVQNEIYGQIEADQVRAAGAGRVPDPVDQLDRLDDLRRRGVISDAEFQAKKAQLLDRL
jgi:hypothetical protein